MKRSTATVITAKKRLELQRVKLQQKLIDTEKKLSAKIEAFRTKKETIKSQYTAAEAQVNVKGAVTGISEEMVDVGFAIDRAEEKTETMRMKSDVLDEIGGDDEIERELKKMKATTCVDDELAKLKVEMEK